MTTKRIPASIRNNNPGAIEGGPSARKFGSTSYEMLRWTYQGKPATNKIATFPTPVHGAAALFDLLYNKYTGSTVESAITKWCGGYFSGTYTAVLEQQCGIKPGDALTKPLVRDAETAIMLAKGMAQQEAGCAFPMSDADWRAAHDMAFAGSVAPEPSADNDVPFPRPEARTRAAVKSAVDAGVKYGLPGLGAGGVAHVATKQESPSASVDDRIATAQKRFDQAKQVKTMAQDASSFVPKSLPVPFVGLAMVIGAFAVVAVVLVRARG